jgi:hypothetical protein
MLKGPNALEIMTELTLDLGHKMADWVVKQSEE